MPLSVGICGMMHGKRRIRCRTGQRTTTTHLDGAALRRKRAASQNGLGSVDRPYISCRFDWVHMYCGSGCCGKARVRRQDTVRDSEH